MMKEKTIIELKKMFAEDKIDEEIIEMLKTDTRKGVKQLIKEYENKRIKEEQVEKRFLEMSTYEKKYYQQGCHYIAGVDEAGRGPLAGPVVAAAVILPKDFKLLGLNDSKQLNESTRKLYFQKIKEQAISYGISVVSNKEIDRINIYEATKVAMMNAIKQLELQADHILIDAVDLGEVPISTESIIKGDQKSISIAAASILAKVTRDQLMKEIHSNYPKYHFLTNMGYGTKQHIEMLKKYGPSPYHRKSFAPVRDLLN